MGSAERENLRKRLHGISLAEMVKNLNEDDRMDVN
jgi:hypothetical protein